MIVMSKKNSWVQKHNDYKEVLKSLTNERTKADRQLRRIENEN